METYIFFQATGSKRSTINDALAASLDDDGDGVITRREMERFEPTTPHPDNVNCHVEVQVVSIYHYIMDRAYCHQTC